MNFSVVAKIYSNFLLIIFELEIRYRKFPKKNVNRAKFPVSEQDGACCESYL
jgi:hypothetical protein